jgi:hypothetical protein
MSLTKVTYSMIDGPQANVKDFGAVGDGVTDDSTAIQAALDSGYPTIVFPPGTYLCGTALSKTMVGGTLNLIGQGNTTIFSTVADPSVFLTIQGTISAGSALSADVAAGDRTITTNESVAVGDLIRIRSSDPWVPHRSGNYKKSEFCRVAGVSGTTITLEWPLYDSYTAATTNVFKVNAPKLSIDNISFLREKAVALGTSLEGLNFQYLQASRFNRVIVKNFTQTNFEIRDSIDIVVNQCETYGDFFVGEGQGYGLLNNSCQNFNVYGGIYVAGRHGIVTGGSNVTRNFVVDGATVSAAGSFAFDTHEGQQDVTVQNCDIRAGLSIFGQQFVVQNNRILGNLQCNTTKGGGYTIISGNNVTNGQMQVLAFQDCGAIATDLISIDNNYVNTSSGLAFRFNTSLDAADTWGVLNFKMTNNFFKTTAAATRCCYFFGNAAVVDIGHMTIINNMFFSDDSLSFEVNENMFEVGSLVVNGNLFETANTASGNAKIYLGPGRPTEANICNNKFFEGTYGVDFNCYLGMLFLNDNVFKNSDYSFQTKGVPNWNNLWTTNNIEINVTSGWNSSLATGRIQSPTQNSNGNTIREIRWGTAAPVSGTFARGSIVFRSNPSAAGKIGFVCTTGGTPGTWKEFGVIDA